MSTLNAGGFEEVEKWMEVEEQFESTGRMVWCTSQQGSSKAGLRNVTSHGR